MGLQGHSCCSCCGSPWVPGWNDQTTIGSAAKASHPKAPGGHRISGWKLHGFVTKGCTKKPWNLNLKNILTYIDIYRLYRIVISHVFFFSSLFSSKFPYLWSTCSQVLSSSRGLWAVGDRRNSLRSRWVRRVTWPSGRLFGWTFGKSRIHFLQSIASGKLT